VIPKVTQLYLPVSHLSPSTADLSRTQPKSPGKLHESYRAQDSDKRNA